MAPKESYYEFIVLGCGGIGSAALYWLSRRSPNGVLGLEQFELGHDHGGSQDDSRTIRLSFVDDVYVKLAKGAYEAWGIVEEESGMKLLYKTGCVNIAHKDSARNLELLEKYAAAMERQGVPFEQLTGTQLKERFPQFTFGDEISALFHKDGGLVDARMANAVHIQLAQARGATVIENCSVTHIGTTEDGITTVETTKGTFRCGRLVVTAGAWIKQVLGSCGVDLPVSVAQEQITSLATPNIKEFTKDNYPVWIYHKDEGKFVGMPIHGNSGIKVMLNGTGPFVTTDTRTYTPDPEQEEKCIQFLKEAVPRSLGPKLCTKTGLIVTPRDQDLVVDTLADMGLQQVIVCCGAGHAFKFASVLGRILSDLSVDGETSFDISLFNINRSSLIDPDMNPVPMDLKGNTP